MSGTASGQMFHEWILETCCMNDPTSMSPEKKFVKDENSAAKFKEMT